MLDLSQSPEHIAKAIKDQFIPLVDDGDLPDWDLIERNCKDCAILCVENMLKVCPEQWEDHMAGVMEPNPDYLKLTQTLKVLRAE